MKDAVAIRMENLQDKFKLKVINLVIVAVGGERD